MNKHDATRATDDAMDTMKVINASLTTPKTKELSNRSLQKIQWSPQKVSLLHRLIQVKGKHLYIQGRQIVLPGEEAKVLEKEFERLPPNMGIKKAYPYIAQKYTGITREALFEWMKSRKAYQEFAMRRKPSHSKAIVSKSPGKRVQIDYFAMPQ